MQSKWQDKVSAKPTETPPLLTENEGLGTVVYVTGEDMDGHTQWAYALIHADKYLDFKEAEAEGNYQLADYGEVLYFGQGAEPPKEIKQKMAEAYGCNEQFEQEIEKMLEEVLEQLMPEILDTGENVRPE